MTVKVFESNGKAVLDSPYHPDLPHKAKSLGGRFNGSDKSWSFDARDIERVRDMARAVYGTIDGDDTSNLVTVRVQINNNRDATNPLWMFGRLIAERRYRDSDVRFGDGVVVTDGHFAPSGGSSKYPSLFGNSSFTQPDTVTVEVRDVPRSLIDSDDDRITIVGQAAGQLDALNARREALVKELADIDAQIAELS